MKNRAVLFALALALLPFSALARAVNDPHAAEQWYLAKVNAPGAWDVTVGSREVIVAVLDSGMDLDHPDLAANLWTNPREIPGNGIDDDGNGYVDDVHGWDFVDDDGFPTPSEGSGDGSLVEDAVVHGTAIAGVIGAVGNNGVGVAGLAWNVRLLPLRILDNSGFGYSSDAERAIRYATAVGADVINLSFTGETLDTSFQDAIREAYEAGVVIVAAVGNTGRTGLDLDEDPLYPACFFGPNGEDYVIGVAATDAEDRRGAFSNYGARCTDVSAPGVNMFSTSFQDAAWSDSFRDAYLGEWDGTSIAAPVVSGIVALMRAVNPALRPETIKTLLQLTVDPVAREGGGAERKLGAGRVNAARAVALAAAYEETGAVRRARAATGRIAVGAERGEAPWVSVRGADGREEARFLAYAEGFTGGVEAVLGDFDGDGEEDVATAPGPGGGPHVRVFARDGRLLGQFFAYDPAFRGGVSLAAYDFDRDGTDELVTGARAGGGPHVRAFALDGRVRANAFPFDPSSRAGVRVRVIDAKLYARPDTSESEWNEFSL